MPLSEITDLLPLVGNVMASDSVEQLHSVSDKIFGGFGQTKVVEDANKEVREKESRTVANKLVSMVRQWGCLRTKDVIAKHGKGELDPTPHGPGVPAEWPEVAKELFTTAQHSPTIDAVSICGRRDWSSFSSQTSKGVYATRQLLLECYARDVLVFLEVLAV